MSHASSKPRRDGFSRSELELFLHEQIPLTRAMELSVTRLGDQLIELSGTLAANHNDKGTAFGGSLAALLTLSGWALLLSRLRQQRLSADVMIHQQQFTYRRPVQHDFAAYCELSDDESWSTFVSTLNKRGKARLNLVAQVQDLVDPSSRADPAAIMEASYVAIKRNHYA